MRKFELIPNDGRKSFYGKAIVKVDNEGNETLYSYGTRILTKRTNGEMVKHWDGYSATTGRHIKAFCGLNKAQYSAL